MKNIKIFAFLAVFLLSAAVSTAWAKDVSLTYKISVTGTIPHAYITNADGKTVCDWRNGIKTLWPANEGHTMNDVYGITFTPDQDLDKTDKNENKKSTSTTAFRTEENTIFTVSVGQGFYFKSVTFKEDGTEKASSSNIIPNSTSIRVEVPENKFFNYITVVLTNDFHYSLSYDENLTVSPSPSMTYNNIPYYAAGQTVTFGFSGSGSVEYFVNGERIEGNSVTVGQEDLTVQIGIPYIDENGKEQIRELGEYTVLTSLTDVSNLPGGWYVVQGKVKYSNQVNFSGDAHFILADGAKLEIETEGNGINATGGNLTIYGQSKQSEQSGTLKVTATGSGIYGSNGVTINGGTVEATGKHDGISSYKGGVTINGGKVTATRTRSSGIYSQNGDIILGWTNSTDFIKASRYFLGNNEKHVSIAEGKSFKDEKGNVYSGTLSAGQFASLKGQKLEPFEGVSVSFVDNFSGASDVFAEIAVDGEGHVSAPSKLPFHSGYAFVGWFAAPEGGSEFDFSAAITGNTTAYAKWKKNTPVEYIDENGSPKSVTDFIVLTEDNKPNENGIINLPGGWYVVQGKVKYSNQVNFGGDAHLILADGAEMVIKSETYGIQADKNLTIYGQNGQRGILNDTANGTNGFGIYSKGTVTIIGGTVTATGHYGIYGYYGITIIGGTVEATGSNRGIYGYYGITISGGSVTATGYYGIYGGNGVTISGGTVTATSTSGSSIYGSNGVTISGGTVKATATNGSGIYSSEGNITISGGSVTATSDYSDGIYSSSGDITLGWTNSTDFIKASSYSLGDNEKHVSIVEGKSFKDENGRVYSGTLSDNQIAAISHQTIEPLPWKNLGDYAAVQIFEDENGKKHAVIDGEYEGTETVDIPNEIAVDAVDYIRDFDANTPSTVLMPVRLPSCATVNAKFYKLDEVYQSGYRWVAKVQNIGKALPQANTAYAVMMPTAGKLEFNFEGCATAEEKQAIVQTDEIQTSGNTDGSWYFTGTYAFKRWTETENKDEVGLVYGFAGSNEDGIAKGQFGRVDFGAHANPLRCYLRKKDKSVVLKTQTLAKAAPQVLKAAPYSISLLPETIDVEFVDDDENGEHTTAIGRMDTRTGKIRLLRTDRTYDLKGRRVDGKNNARGAYYGKKF